MTRLLHYLFALFAGLLLTQSQAVEDPPHIILVMADDQGWGQVGYRNHPHLKTPNLDAMAASGLRFERFYAGASNCSPTRATVLTGRSNDRTGVETHGFPLRLQEKTIAQALRDAGYATAHFGKWHLNGLRGPGVPVLADDTHHPGHFGFTYWSTLTNFFDRDPLINALGGSFTEVSGDSSEIIVDDAVAWIKKTIAETNQPTFSVIWYGSPHDPMIASEADRAPFADLDSRTQHHLGEIVALDRSIGTLRTGLRELGITDQTLVWYCSDNGGLSNTGDGAAMGGLRGAKNTLFEGGLRVPGIIEWPAEIAPQITDEPAATVDIFPTLAK
ncbi:MAG: sulfatase-like hydrolase/transferase, partial [Verrucomicrobiota bacterium]